MKILHCNTYESIGGAAIAARRIHSALRDAGADSFMYVNSRSSDSPYVLCDKRARYKHLANKIVQKIENVGRKFFYKLPASVDHCTFPYLPRIIGTTLAAFDRDITHLHWVNDRFLLPQDIRKISGPVVWTLHDRNPITGGCHVRRGCERYKMKCGQCPQLGSTKNWDLSHLNWLYRSRALKGKHIHIVCPSKRLAEEARQSSLVGAFPVSTIPNCVPTNIYRPIDKALCRRLLNIPGDDRPLLLFGAISAMADHNKGYDLLMSALAQIPNNTYRCLIFGASAPLGEQKDGTMWLGRLHDDISLALAYNAADVFVCPSREENLPNTVMEALACGTPAVGFDVGGLPDMITHGEHGFLAKPYDTGELAHHITSLLADSELRQRMGRAARQKVEQCYAPEVVAREYLALYEEILGHE